MRQKLFMSIFILALAPPSAPAQPDFTFNLSAAAMSGVGTNEVFFAGTLAGTDPATNFLNDIQITFTGTATNYLLADTNVFFANVPGILLPDESYQDVVFGIAINPATPPGIYSGLVVILGGTNIFDATSLSSQTFQVLLPPAALGAALNGTNLVLSWPSPPGGFALQQNPGLTAANWTAVTNTPAHANFLNQVSLPPAGGSQLYRLMYP